MSSTINLASASIGTYNLLVTDSKGCSDTAGPYSITGTSGPVINSTGVIVTNQSLKMLMKYHFNKLTLIQNKNSFQIQKKSNCLKKKR